MAGTSDPTAVEVVAVTAEDVLAALEANRRRDGEFVVRITPPFHARIRGRVHRADVAETDADPPPVHVDVDALFESVPEYPTVDGTADRLRAAGEYSTDRHREAHVRAVEAWRESVREARAERVRIETPAGAHEVRLAWLG
jgi:hypothetical protein